MALRLQSAHSSAHTSVYTQSIAILLDFDSSAAADDIDAALRGAAVVVVVVALDDAGVGAAMEKPHLPHLFITSQALQVGHFLLPIE